MTYEFSDPATMSLLSPTSRLIALVLVLTIAAGLVWNFYWARQPDIDEVGGTILVYRIDRGAKQAVHNDTKLIAETLQRRFVFDGLRHIMARPAGPEEVEVRVPRVGDHQAEVQAIKAMVAQVGRLEFRILANSHDDIQAIEAAQRMINEERAVDPKLDQEIQDAQNQGLPPPGPRNDDGEPRKYDLILARGQKSTVSYSWVELSEAERRSLNLDNAARDDPRRDAAWKEAFAHRGKARQLPETHEGALMMQGALFYSRACKDGNLPEEERRKKDVDYFVLARDPEFDPVTGKHTPDIDGTYLASAHADRDATGRPVIGFTLNAAGAELFGTLTRKNVTEGPPGGPRTVRHLAIVLDGLVMSAPTINSEIRDRGMISGSFTQRQVEEMVSILRAGALPGALLPRPVREVAVEPRG
jgi:SecD/SecF fusion protein